MDGPLWAQRLFYYIMYYQEILRQWNLKKKTKKIKVGAEIACDTMRYWLCYTFWTWISCEHFAEVSKVSCILGVATLWVECMATPADQRT